MVGCHVGGPPAVGKAAAHVGALLQLLDELTGERRRREAGGVHHRLLRISLERDRADLEDEEADGHGAERDGGEDVPEGAPAEGLQDGGEREGEHCGRTAPRVGARHSVGRRAPSVGRARRGRCGAPKPPREKAHAIQVVETASIFSK